MNIDIIDQFLKYFYEILSQNISQTSEKNPHSLASKECKSIFATTY